MEKVAEHAKAREDKILAASEFLERYPEMVEELGHREACPDCPDGNEWKSSGPTGAPCPTCNGEGYIAVVGPFPQEPAPGSPEAVAVAAAAIRQLIATPPEIRRQAEAGLCKPGHWFSPAAIAELEARAEGAERALAAQWRRAVRAERDLEAESQAHIGMTLEKEIWKRRTEHAERELAIASADALEAREAINQLVREALRRSGGAS